MAFTKGSFLPLSSMANSGAPRHFTYSTEDTKATTVASGYFDDAALTLGLKKGDLVWVVGVTAGVEVFTLVFIDAISAAGVVTVKSSTLTLA